jgi:DNA mismatch repair protein MutS2
MDYAHARPGVVNASVEFDVETLQPTFRLTIGLPGRSNALAIASRLGLPQPIIEEARAELSPDDLRAEDLLNEIHHQRETARRARLEAEQAQKEAEALRNELFDRLEKVEDERRKMLEEARQQAAARIEELQAEITEVRKVLVRARQPVDVLQTVEEKVEEFQEAAEQPVIRQEPELGPVLRKSEQDRRRSIRLGDKVRLRALGAPGVVIGLSNEEAEVQVGVMRVRSRLAELELFTSSVQELPSGGQKKSGERKLAAVNPSATPDSTRTTITQPASPGIELDLRGKRADDALDDLDRYLDSAYLAGLPFVRVIHGKGTGRLREVVRQALQSHPHVKSFENGGEKEGGDGVTVAKLAVS